MSKQSAIADLIARQLEAELLAYEAELIELRLNGDGQTKIDMSKYPSLIAPSNNHIAISKHVDMISRIGGRITVA